jgi:hypothetical protein
MTPVVVIPVVVVPAVVIRVGDPGLADDGD